MIYITKHETEAAYNAVKDKLEEPHVAYIVETNSVWYKPIDNRLIVTYNVTDASNPIWIMYSSAITNNYFTEVEIDGVKADTIESAYTLSVGEHTVKYTLTDPTSIGDNAFQGCINISNVTILDKLTSIGDMSFAGCSGLTNITIPDSVTTIGNQAFVSCNALTSVTIGSGVTNIGNAAFADLRNITNITIKATTPPTLGGSVFTNNCTIYVPSGSVDTYKVANGWSSYASWIQAIPTT